MRCAMMPLTPPGPLLLHAGWHLQWWSKWDYMRVSQEEVQSAFERFGLLDKRVHFHKVCLAG